MHRYAVWLTSFLFIIFHLPQSAASQDSRAQPQPSASRSSSEAVATFQTSTRMVTLEVVVKDHRGNHVTGLTAADFQVLEQTPSRGKQKYEQKIAAFREVRMADLARQASSTTQVPAGVYTNLVALHKDPVPPTILLVDGLNTELRFQGQVHVQMVRMLKSLPRNVPVAVFLFGHRLRMLQDFTTDPSLLQAALEQATSAAGHAVATLDPRDDPDAVSAQLESINGGPTGAHAAPELIAGVKKFEQEVYLGTMDLRVHETIDALTWLALHVEGFPGRKNLLWVSTSFPIRLGDHEDFHNYTEEVQRLSRVLSQAKVALYPINPAGVVPPSVYEADARPRDNPRTGLGDSLQREVGMSNAAQDTMELVAEDTGGRICTGDNDLGDCIRKAVDDSSEFYEIAYYPDSPNWNGEYRKIILKSKQPGLHLEYRQGYYARLAGESSQKDQDADLRQAACEDYLNATSIFMAAKPLPADSGEQLKFYLMVNPAALTLVPTSNGDHDLNIIVAACTFDKKGYPAQLSSETIHRKLDPNEYQALMKDGLPHIVSVPGAKPAAVRLLVKDVPSGRIGSVSIKVDDTMASPAVTTTEKGAAQQSATPH